MNIDISLLVNSFALIDSCICTKFVSQLLFLMADEKQNVPKEKLLRAYDIVGVVQDVHTQEYTTEVDDGTWDGTEAE